jgi:hypothetical protein
MLIFGSEGDRKAYYESSQATIIQNKDVIAAIRAENKELHAALNSLERQRQQENPSLSMETEIARTDRAVCDLRKKFDAQRHSLQAAIELSTQLTAAVAEAEAESLDPSDDDTADARRLRSLENRLDEAVIKANEALSLQKTYRHICDHLGKERSTFDARIAELERGVKAKERDADEIRMLLGDAQAASDMARLELEHFTAALEADRAARTAELAERRDLVSRRSEAESTAREDAARLRAETAAAVLAATQAAEVSEVDAKKDTTEVYTPYIAAMSRIHAATGLETPQELRTKCRNQADTAARFEASAADVQLRIKELTDDRARLRANVEDIRFSGAAAGGSRRVLEELDSQIADARLATDREREPCDRLQKLSVDVRSGLLHLLDMVVHVRSSLPPAATPALSEATLVQLAQLCNSKMALIISVVSDAIWAELELDIGADEDFDLAVAVAPVAVAEPPAAPAPGAAPTPVPAPTPSRSGSKAAVSGRAPLGRDALKARSIAIVEAKERAAADDAVVE